MATQENTFMETDHPLVRRIWKMLEEEIPAEFVEATNIVTSTRYHKSAAQATLLRSLGEHFSFEFNYSAATTCCSMSVAAAPADSEELGLAYVGRSALLWRRRVYDLCLLDANRAWNGPLPPFIVEECWQRRIAASKKLLKQKISQIRMRETINQFKHHHGQGEELNAWQRKSGYASRVGANDTDLVIDHSRLDDPIWKTEADNSVPDYMSPKIVLRIDAQMAPHLIARDDIEAGEILRTDELYSSSLYKQMRFEYCDYCHFQCDALVPCSDCTLSMYCNDTCREKAYDTYHRIECQIPPEWSSVDEGRREIRTLLLRTFLRVTKQGSELANLMNSPLVREALDGKLDCVYVPFSPENYLILAGVVSRLRYSNHENMTCDPVMIKDTLAIFAALRSIKFFGNEDTGIQRFGNVLNAKEYFGIMLLVCQISLVIPHFFHLGVYMVDSLAEPSLGATKSIGIGFNLWQCFSLHSCDPNASRIVNKRHMLVYAARYIKAGEQICPLGHVQFGSSPLEERKDRFKAYGCPECTCKACVENWPMLTDLVHRRDSYRTDDETKNREIQNARVWLFANCSLPINKYHLEAVFPLLRDIREYVEGPSATICMCELYLGRFMLSKGNMQMYPK